MYEGRLIQAPTLDEIRAVARDYEIMLVSILGALLDRYERNPAYPFIDTKLNILTGKDHPEPHDPSTDIRGKSAIYGTIQGRGLEALVGHLKWLPTCSVLSAVEITDWTQRLTAMVEGVFHHMESLRAENNDCVPGLMTPAGKAFVMGSDGRREFISLAGVRSTLADLFYSKGMLASALLLGEAEKVLGAKHRLRMVAANVITGWPGNQPRGKGRWNRPLTSGMITIGSFTLFADLLKEDEWFVWGELFIRHVLGTHINLGQFGDLQRYDHTEYVDVQGLPWHDERGRILLDPGHCLEFVGLASKLLLLVREKDNITREEQELLERCTHIFPKVLLRNFELGFNRQMGGVFKSVDLLTGEPINSDMPWWNLPEIMRAASELLLLMPTREGRKPLLQVIADCSNAFVSNFVNRDVYLMAYQTVGANGHPVDVIPLTSDLDPGYHTGLCIIDFLECLRRLEESG